MIRTYNTPQKFREGSLLHIEHLYNEIVTSQRRLTKAEKEAAAIKERIKRLKKQLGHNG